jgi:ATP-dependent Lon protease
MRTSSGDEINLDFSNHNSASIKHKEDENGSSTSMKFSSEQSFAFSVKTNGIDAQDQKEIQEFMKIAQPFIDDFLKELSEDAPKTPVTELAHKVASMFNPNKDRDENNTNNVKTNIVEMFDKSLSKLDTEELMKKVYEDAKKLLEKTLKEFDEFNKNIYA